MQHELQQLQPVLAQTAKEVGEMMIAITADKREAGETKLTVEVQEKGANEQVGQVGLVVCQHMLGLVVCSGMYVMDSYSQEAVISR